MVRLCLLFHCFPFVYFGAVLAIFYFAYIQVPGFRPDNLNISLSGVETIFGLISVRFPRGFLENRVALLRRRLCERGFGSDCGDRARRWPSLGLSAKSRIVIACLFFVGRDCRNGWRSVPADKAITRQGLVRRPCSAARPPRHRAAWGGRQPRRSAARRLRARCRFRRLGRASRSCHASHHSRANGASR